MPETPINPELEKIIVSSLNDTKEWGWDEDDRKWSACGTALKYMESRSNLEGLEARAAIMATVQQLMKE